MSSIQDIVVLMGVVSLVLWIIWIIWYARVMRLVTKNYAAGQRWAIQPAEGLERER